MNKAPPLDPDPKVDISDKVTLIMRILANEVLEPRFSIFIEMEPPSSRAVEL